MNSTSKKVVETEGKEVERKTKAAEAKATGINLAAGQIVYIGPEVKNVISKNTIFRNGVPEELKEKIAEIPILEKLFIPLAELPKANKALSDGGAYKAIYDNAAKVIAEWEKNK